MGSIIKNGINYTGGSGASSYNELSDKPSIENIPLSGNKSASDLGLIKESDLADVATTGDYDDLIHKPSIPVILDNIADVDVSSPANGQVLKYNSTSGMWENGTGGGGGSYTAGDGISIENDEISIDPMPAEDVDEVIDIYPTAGELVSIVNAFNKGDIYSTSEKMIGQWIDGKPLYQKTLDIPAITAQVGSNDYIPIIADGTNYEVKSLVGFVNNGLGSVVVLPEVDIYARVVVRPVVRNTSSNNAICINVKNRGAEDNPQPYNIIKGGKLTIKYTKVSDTAISIGSETEYSTEEKVVGTWIDGKPLYQKTLNFVPTTGDVSQTFNHGISNVDTIMYDLSASFVAGEVNGVKQNWSFSSNNINLNATTYTASGFYFTPVRITPTDFQYLIGADLLNRTIKVILTVRYTKTTT